MSITRRTLVKAFPFIGAVVAVPVTAFAEAKPSVAQPECPGVRLANALIEVKEALRELYGVEPDDQSLSTKDMGVIAISAMPHPMDRMVWSIDDGSPLVGSPAEWAAYDAERKRLAP